MVRVKLVSAPMSDLESNGRIGEILLELGTEESRTVRALFGRLATKYPRFERTVFDAQTGRLTEKVSVLLNGRHLELANGLDTELKDGDTLSLVPPIAGG